MRRLRQKLDGFFERHPRLRLLDRVLGTPLYAVMWAVGLTTILAALGVHEAVLQVVVVIAFIGVFAVMTRQELRNKRP